MTPLLRQSVRALASAVLVVLILLALCLAMPFILLAHFAGVLD